MCPVMETHYLPKRNTVLQYPQLLISIYFMGVAYYEEHRSLKQMALSLRIVCFDIIKLRSFLYCM